MKKLIRPLALCVLFHLSFASVQAQDKDTVRGVKWLKMEDALRMNQVSPKKIFIDVYTSWCGWCKRMDATTFSDKEVSDYLNEKFYSVKLDAETRDTINYQDKVFLYKPEYKANEFAVYILNGKMSYPTTVYLDENSKPIGPVPGYLTKEQMLPVLKYFAEDIYKTKAWEDYLKEQFR
ncbi:MAG: DUF255 domain-containing protein [Bacteroidetes bacterium]|nr:MAG: DUF255 domain-containing protein [Bacteroidota bacterium]REK08066.1 MAG: DUF255 domain-containing protein [Bacteroidota bacterium]REK32271.1 MAG: DUF255 domain-containing protein [Bacteroidota bacterium]REK47423.1 MAG: DUF255 domain-containing protein [Bacteroidota bacterium]